MKAREKVIWFPESRECVQIAPGNDVVDLVAFGIPINSRYRDALEIMAMMRFTRVCAQHQLAHLVTSVYCDSKVPAYWVELADGVEFGDAEDRAMFEIAKMTLDQFIWPTDETNTIY